MPSDRFDDSDGSDRSSGAGGRSGAGGPSDRGAGSLTERRGAQRVARGLEWRSARSVECEDVAEVLAAIADGTDRADRRTQRHVETCLRCQAELVQYRKLLRVLHQLRTDVLEPAPGVLTGILAGIEEAGEHGAIRSLLSGRRAAYIGGVAVATAAAGAAGAVVLISRAARRRVDLAG